MGAEISEDPIVAKLYDSLINESTSDPYDDSVRFVEFLRASKGPIDCLQKLRLKVSTITSSSDDPIKLERLMKFLLMVQFEGTKSLPSHDPNSIDHDLSEWASEVLERLRICLISRSDWRRYVDNELVNRFHETHPKTLSQIHLNIGLDTPSCLPKLSDEEGENEPETQDNKTFVNAIHKESRAKKTLQSPIQTPLSPRSEKRYLRNSLPRALFVDPVIAIATTLANSSSKTSTHTNSMTPLSTQCTPTCSSSYNFDENPYLTRSKSSASQLILMPTLPRSNKRKTKMPVKNIAGSSRKRQQPSKSASTTGRRRYSRCVKETPKGKASQPLWERARDAAAAKVKDRLLIIPETPLKPSNPVEDENNPDLRRLRRIKSLLLESGGSRIGAKAEQWVRARQEEELRLCSTSLEGPYSHSLPTNFKKERSNLMDNFIQQDNEALAKEQQQMPRTSRTVSSPPVLNMVKLRSDSTPSRRPSKDSLKGGGSGATAAPSSLSVTEVVTPTTRRKRKATCECTVASPGTRGTPKRQRTAVQRIQQQELCNTPSSPDVCDDAAMFMGNEEFFRRTNALSTSFLQSPVQLAVDSGDGKEVGKLTSRCQSPQASLRSTNKTPSHRSIRGPKVVMQRCDRLTELSPTTSSAAARAVKSGLLSPSKSPAARKATPRKNLAKIFHRMSADHSTTVSQNQEEEKGDVTCRKKLRPRRSLFK